MYVFDVHWSMSAKIQQGQKQWSLYVDKPYTVNRLQLCRDTELYCLVRSTHTYVCGWDGTIGSGHQGRVFMYHLFHCFSLYIRTLQCGVFSFLEPSAEILSCENFPLYGT